MSNRWLIFDFDGVIADSEVLANLVLAEIVTALGVATTLEDSYRRKDAGRGAQHALAQAIVDALKR